MRTYGHTVFGDHDDEILIQPDPNAAPYSLDLCSLSDKGVSVCEIDGYQGHGSRRAIRKDLHRTNAIIEYFKKNGLKARVFRFAFYQLTDMDDETIAKELELIPN